MDETWLRCLPNTIQDRIRALPSTVFDEIEEIRVREGRPLEIGLYRGFRFLEDNGSKNYYIPSKADCRFILELLTEHSLYSYEEQLQSGYITLRGGHRVGIVGRTTVENNKVRHVKDVAGFNIRIARQSIGCSRALLSDLLDRDGETIHHTLVISPPQQGKTTLLRDFSRLISDGQWPEFVQWPSKKVGIIDERSEIAACVQGVPHFNVGLRTDVLDNCPKAEGMMMMIRSMSPQVIVVDEIGREEDAHAIYEASHAGIRVLTSAHGNSIGDIRKRPMLRALIESCVFQRYIEIGNYYAKGNIYRIYDGSGKELSNHILQRGSYV